MKTETEEKTTISIGELIKEGGDDRLKQADNRKNKYNIDPADYKGLINRGSCTCSALNSFTHQILSTKRASFTQEKFLQTRNEHIARIKSLLNYEGFDKFSCFFAPSGSDLSYYPLLFAQMIHPGKKILNLLTCKEELGSGTQIAAYGQYFMERNQFGTSVTKNDSISEELDIEVRTYKARDEEGRILDHKIDMLRTLNENKDFARIANLVIGSKSGIENNINVILESDPSILWTVDLCQFRNSKRLINKLLDLQCLIMITGSKFYQSPPFCGVLLVPNSLVDRLHQADIPDVSAFQGIFSRHDFPTNLHKLAAHFPDFKNIGLLARWECAIAEMEQFDSIPAATSLDIIRSWNTIIRQSLDQYPEFVLMPNQEMTNQSIISFRVRVNGTFLAYQNLQLLFKTLVEEKHPELVGYDRFFIGQPVNYGDQSFIRLALGAHDLRMELAAKKRFENDAIIVKIIRETALRLFSK